MNKLVFVNRFFYPDISATSQMLSDLCFGLEDIDMDIHVVTSRLTYTDDAKALPAEEVIMGVTVHRVWTTRFGRRFLPGRALDYLSFYIACGFTLLSLLGRGDIVVAKTDPPMISIVVKFAARICKAQQINWLQDLFPEILLSIKAIKKKNSFYKLIKVFRNWSLRNVACNVAIGAIMATHLKQVGLGTEEMRVIHNWADGEKIVPVTHDENNLRNEWGLQNKLVIAYSGNLGRGHEFDRILALIEKFKINHSIRFLFIGGGAKFELLEEACKERGLFNVWFKPYQARERLHLSLSVADVHMISLKEELEGFMVPSKFYGIAAAGRAMIFFGDKDGELAQLIRDNELGWVINSSNDVDYQQLINELNINLDSVRIKGNKARILFEQRFSKQYAISQWADLFRTIHQQASVKHANKLEKV